MLIKLNLNQFIERTLVNEIIHAIYYTDLCLSIRSLVVYNI